MASQQMLSASKKPRLSLQIKTSSISTPKGMRGYPVNPSDPTAFNTLSNVYVTAIDRSSSVQSEPVTAINTLQACSLEAPAEYKDTNPRVFTPYVASYPETPLTALLDSPSKMEFHYPSTMTATPPLSAGPTDSSSSKLFAFSSSAISCTQSPQTLSSPVECRALRPRLRPCQPLGLGLQPPYTHPRSLHSILRNSPLPPRTAIPQPSPKRQSVRLQEKAAKKVGYNNPLTQEITTNRYTKSHIDLLTDDASPNSPALPAEPENVLNVALAFTANEIQDGGQTPGPFEDMRRGMAGLGHAPISPAEPRGARKRKRTEKKRQWVWTIGQGDDGEDIGGAVAVSRAQVGKKSADSTLAKTTGVPEITYLETPTPSIENIDSVTGSVDIEMSDTSSATSEDLRHEPRAPSETALVLKTPIAPRQPGDSMERKRDSPIPELSEERDTPIPLELM
ncbi:hypothetical protein TOPH_01059 [Tolypocladium ophioglossoides CBS 100239]|uniref:Uncharacterized protein n=1 Tax=Tolypocladium ophioglossoides (strain CBS 100239) TaxID=1163406 RepID=A0A0L0NJM4_TOLOC|nr:hypothetical protein TOPH_01059 [Tolypocladium ophioglossoides CBS 100239]